MCNILWYSVLLNTTSLGKHHKIVIMDKGVTILRCKLTTKLLNTITTTKHTAIDALYIYTYLDAL